MRAHTKETCVSYKNFPKIPIVGSAGPSPVSNTLLNKLHEHGFQTFHTAKPVVLTGVHRGQHQALYTGVKFLVLAQ